QREAVGRDDADVAFDVDEAAFVEGLRVHHRAVDVGKDLEFRCATNVIAVARGAVADDAVAIGGMTHLPGLEGLDHAVLLGHAADPLVALDAHCPVLGVARILGFAAMDLVASSAATWQSSGPVARACKRRCVVSSSGTNSRWSCCAVGRGSCNARLNS